MFSLLLSSICYAGNNEADLIEKINQLVSSGYKGTVIEDSLSKKFLGKVVAPDIYQDTNALIERVNERYLSSCVYDTQYVYLLNKNQFDTLSKTFEIGVKTTAINYDVVMYPAQLKIICFNCDNNVNDDLKRLYLKDIKNCTQGG